MGRLRKPDDCQHGSVMRRQAGPGTPLNGLYCLDCGALVKRVPGLGAEVRWMPLGPVMDRTPLLELRARLNWTDDTEPPANIRLAPDAPGYAVPDGPKD